MCVVELGGMTNSVRKVQIISTKLNQIGFQLTSVCDDVAVLPFLEEEFHFFGMSSLSE